MAKVHARTFEWSFDAPPGSLWPTLGDTARFNEADGIPKHTIEEALQDEGHVRFFARAHKGPLGLPITLAWEETPVEWVDHRWFRHCREFSKGPLRMLCPTLELEPAGKDGALGHYKVEVSAANLLGTLTLATVFFPNCAAHLHPPRGSGGRMDVWHARPYKRPLPALGTEAQARIDHIVARVERSPNGHGLAVRLVDWMLREQEFGLFSIRPIALARHWDANPMPSRCACRRYARDCLNSAGTSCVRAAAAPS